METWRDVVNSVTVRPASPKDYVINDARRKGMTLTKPLEEHDSWTELVEPAGMPHPDRLWSPRLAIKNLQIKVVEFEDRPDHVKGYANGNRIAVRPNISSPLRTLFHELAHVALRHTYKPDPFDRGYNINEIQAETTGFLCLTYAGAATRALAARSRIYNRNYITKAKRWPTEQEYEQCFEAAQIIITAGRPDGRPVELVHK